RPEGLDGGQRQQSAPERGLSTSGWTSGQDVGRSCWLHSSQYSGSEGKNSSWKCSNSANPAGKTYGSPCCDPSGLASSVTCTTGACRRDRKPSFSTPVVPDDPPRTDRKD